MEIQEKLGAMSFAISLLIFNNFPVYGEVFGYAGSVILVFYLFLFGVMFLLFGGESTLYDVFEGDEQ